MPAAPSAGGMMVGTVAVAMAGSSWAFPAHTGRDDREDISSKPPEP
jgi:hypothetical protein